MIRVEQVTRTYAHVRALSSVTLAVEAAERVVITGARGSGRSTLLAVIAGRLPLSAGVVTVDGIDVMRDPFAVRRRVSWIAPVRWNRTAMRVREYLSLVAGCRQTGRDAVVKALDESTLDGDRPLQGLRPDEQAVLTMILASMSTTPVLLLDDVLVNGPEGAAWGRVLAAARQRGATIVATADNARDLPGVWDRTLVLDAGRIVASNSPSPTAHSTPADAPTALVHA